MATSDHLGILLLAIGLLTCLPAVLLVSPGPGARRLLGIETTDFSLLLVLRHWGVVVACLGVLLIWSAFEPTLRIPAMVLAGAEKAVIVWLVASNRNRPETKGLRLVVLIDGVSVLLFAFALLRMT